MREVAVVFKMAGGRIRATSLKVLGYAVVAVVGFMAGEAIVGYAFADNVARPVTDHCGAEEEQEEEIPSHVINRDNAHTKVVKAIGEPETPENGSATDELDSITSLLAQSSDRLQGSEPSPLVEELGPPTRRTLQWSPTKDVTLAPQTGTATHDSGGGKTDNIADDGSSDRLRTAANADCDDSAIICDVDDATDVTTHPTSATAHPQNCSPDTSPLEGHPDPVALAGPADISDVVEAVEDDNLVVSASQGDLHTLEELLATGVDLEMTDASGSTALIAAAARGHADVVSVLLDHGARTDTKNNFGVTAFEAAPCRGAPGDLGVVLMARLRPRPDARWRSPHYT